MLDIMDYHGYGPIISCWTYLCCSDYNTSNDERVRNDRRCQGSKHVDCRPTHWSVLDLGLYASLCDLENNAAMPHGNVQVTYSNLEHCLLYRVAPATDVRSSPLDSVKLKLARPTSR